MSNQDTSSSTPANDSQATEVKKLEYPCLFRLVHWLLAISTIVLVLTGLSLHASARPAWSLLGGHLPSWFWTGRVHLWHQIAALVFTPSAIVAAFLYLRNRIKFRPTHVILLLGSLLLIVSGYFLGNPPQSALLYQASLWTHAVVGLVILPVWFLWHAGTGLTRYLGMLVPAFHPWARPRLLPVVGLLVLAVPTSCILMNFWPIKLPWRTLSVKKIEATEVTDLAALPWDEAKPLEIQLAGGNAMDGGRSLLTLRALHDGQELFVKAQWEDDDENYDYWPWERTEDGWKYLQTSPKDECKCYEDKFSLVFPIGPDANFDRFGCMMSCHVDGANGWGYKASVPRVDVWHWKSARTDPTDQVDDKYWDVFDSENKDFGRHGDPKQGGGYTKNVSEDGTHPLLLPESPDVVFHGSFPKDRSVEYTEELAAAIAPGEKIPGVATAPFVGDRGNVTCKSSYADGIWTLYIRRKLETGSEYDTQFKPGDYTSFSAAAFDHSGKRHAYALPTYYLSLEP